MMIHKNIGSLVARVQCAVYSIAQGAVIQDHLSWNLSKDTESGGSYPSNQALAHFFIPEGMYRIEAQYEQRLLEFGTIRFAKNTGYDIIFILEEELDPVILDSDSYFLEYDANLDYALRQRLRELQVGGSKLPLRSPHSEPSSLGSVLETHPILANSVQFSGLPPEIQVEPAHNPDALKLTLQQRLAAQNTPHAAPTPHAI